MSQNAVSVDDSSADSAASSSCSSGDTTSRMKVYKSKLRYNPEWRLKWPWIEYNDAAAREKGCYVPFASSLESHPPKLMVHGLLGLSATG